MAPSALPLSAALRSRRRSTKHETSGGVAVETGSNLSRHAAADVQNNDGHEISGSSYTDTTRNNHDHEFVMFSAAPE